MLWDESIIWNKSSGPHCVSVMLNLNQSCKRRTHKWWKMICATVFARAPARWTNTRNSLEFFRIFSKSNSSETKTKWKQIQWKMHHVFLWCWFDVVIAGLSMLIRRKRHRPFDISQSTCANNMELQYCSRCYCSWLLAFHIGIGFVGDPFWLHYYGWSIGLTLYALDKY